MYACLGVSAASAKALAAAYRKPVIGIHHMVSPHSPCPTGRYNADTEQQAHALTPLLTEGVPPTFPFLVLLVSGGHTQLVLALALDRFSIIADTLDSKIG